MRSSRLLLPLLIAPIMGADRCTRKCCFDGSSYQWITTSDCEAGGGQVDGGYTDEASCLDASSGGETDCASFCAAQAAACPGDTACEHSCDTAPNALTAADVACMEAATDCDSANDCWGPLFAQ
jgi:hypothetical protein